MEALREILAFDFLLRNALWTVLLIGFACPVVGVFLVLRRLAFLGVALPQISSTGVALALSLHAWFGSHDHGHGTATSLAFAGSLGFSLTAVMAFAWLARHRRGSSEGLLGTAFVVSSAISLLLLAKCPQAEQTWMHQLKGELIAISGDELGWTATTLGLVLALIAVFRREFLLVSFDWELARTMRKSVVGWDVFLYLLIGLTVSAAVMSVGPLIAFGFLLVPPLIAHRIAGNMRQLFALSSVIGGLAAFVGFYVAYVWDVPVGPAAVAVLGILYAFVAIAQRCLTRKPRTNA